MGKNFFSLRAVHPVVYKGTLIGYLELGQEIDHIFKDLSAITGDDVSVFLTDEFLKSKSAELKAERVGDFILLDSTHRETGLRLAEKVMLDKGLKEMAVFDVELRGARYAVGLGPLKDASGATAGVLLFEHEVDALYASIRKNILIVVVLFGLLLGAAIVVFYFSIRTSLALFKHVSASAQKIADGDLDVDLATDRTDEIGQLALAFKRMIDYLKGMAKVAGAIAEGDLRETVKPKSEKDVLGNAIQNMNLYLKNMADVAGSIAEGDLASEVKPKSGKDMLGNSFHTMILYVKEMALAASNIAEGDLRADVKPKSGKDILGNSFQSMLAGLRGIIADVRNGAEEIASTSSQVALTSQQAAKNNETAATGVEETTSTMHEMSANIQNVAKNSQSQASSVDRDVGFGRADGNVDSADRKHREAVRGTVRENKEGCGHGS